MVINHLFFGIELLFLIMIGIKYKILSCQFLIYTIIFFYAQAYYLDHLLFSFPNNPFVLSTYGHHVDITDSGYLITQLLYLILLTTFSLPVLIIKDKKQNRIEWICQNQIATKIGHGVIALIIGFVSINLLFMDRPEKIAFWTSHKPLTFFCNVMPYLWCISALYYQKIFCRRNIIFSIFSGSILVFGVFEGGRETILLFALVIIFLYQHKLNGLKLFLIGLFGVLLMMTWKAILVALLLKDPGLLFADWMFRAGAWSISRVDPGASIVICSEYFQGITTHLFDDFKGNYWKAPFLQVFRTLGLIDAPRLAETIKAYYIGPNNVQGLATSGLLEAYLSLFVFGPILLGGVLSWISLKINTYKLTDKHTYSILSILITIITIKLVRTEFATILKLYVLPMITASMLYWVSNWKYIWKK